jgi:hypothetical protein
MLVAASLSIQTNLVPLSEIHRFLDRPTRGLFTTLKQLSLFIPTGLLIPLQHCYLLLLPPPPPYMTSDMSMAAHQQSEANLAATNILRR